jgi:type II secretory pathway component PulM
MSTEYAMRAKLSTLEQKIRAIEKERAELLANAQLDTILIKASARQSGVLIKQYNDARRVLLVKLKKSQQKMGRILPRA